MNDLSCPLAPVFANVIFEAFRAPYFAYLQNFVIAVTIVIEFLALTVFNRGRNPLFLLLVTIFANLSSWMAGYCLSPFLIISAGLDWVETQGGFILQADASWKTCAYLAVLQAFVVSVAIEYFIVSVFNIKRRLSRVFESVVVGNVISHFVIWLVIINRF